MMVLINFEDGFDSFSLYGVVMVCVLIQGLYLYICLCVRAFWN